ncbi:hypothetical protein LEP1GSC082_1106 [Leptospira kirschneri str. H2]|nr:hypothetical protein LEP1GSC082_1106 [Leptospira kirschneri str. H2]
MTTQDLANIQQRRSEAGRQRTEFSIRIFYSLMNNSLS